MKKILVVVALSLVVGGVYANGSRPDTPIGMSVIKSGHVFKVFYRGEQMSNVKVTIYNESGQKVFAETMKNREHFMRPYNFSYLPEGNYTIELADGQGKLVQKVRYSAASVKRVAHLTRLNANTNKYVLSVPNEGHDSLTIKIFDGTNTLLYKQTEPIQGDFAKVYNLEQVAGNHTFEISDANGRVNRLTK